MNASPIRRVNYPRPRGRGFPLHSPLARRPRVEGGAPRTPRGVPTRSPQYIEGCVVVAIRGPAAPGTDEDAVGERQILPRGGTFRPKTPNEINKSY